MPSNRPKPPIPEKTASANLVSFVIRGERPNWRDAAAYPNPQTTTLETWANEFLLRNPDFQRDLKALYDELISRLEASKSEGSNQLEAIGMTADQLAFYGSLNAGVVSLAQQYGIHQALPFQVMQISTRTYDELYGRVYETLKSLESVIQADAQNLLRVVINAFPAPHDDPQREYWIQRKEPAQLGIRFHLEHPLKQQLAQARKLLRAEQKRLAAAGGIKVVRMRANRKKAKLYCTYLRLLDGESQGATVQEMAVAIFPAALNEYPEHSGDHAVRDALRAARKLRDRDYRHLALLEK